MISVPVAARLQPPRLEGVGSGFAGRVHRRDASIFSKQAGPEWRSNLFGSGRKQFRNELRINHLLLREPPPVPFPRLLDFHATTRTLVFEAIDGSPFGPKFPLELSDADVESLSELTYRLSPYRPRRRWMRRLRLESRLRLHCKSRLLDDRDAGLLASTLTPSQRHWKFAHADITARNVLRRGDGEAVLIDWEWAGLFPPLYDVAFLWFSLVDVRGARERIASGIAERDRAAFLGSAALVQLLHLQMWLNNPKITEAIRDKHARQLHDNLSLLRKVGAESPA